MFITTYRAFLPELMTTWVLKCEEVMEHDIHCSLGFSRMCLLCSIYSFISFSRLQSLPTFLQQRLTGRTMWYAFDLDITLAKTPVEISFMQLWQLKYLDNTKIRNKVCNYFCVIPGLNKLRKKKGMWSLKKVKENGTQINTDSFSKVQTNCLIS